ncbi:sodium-dependent transporter [Desulfogranum mediterraneum]|uniref:sodium-dependent transporter n=1 Tax=Desulfogranum mediterraneum TaxID=160661 RepID=UPI0003F50AE8|nr:sodium-dependent transporter [Desulfogranum mediterraneum]
MGSQPSAAVENPSGRISFSNRLSIIAVAAGSAIGLGNIWKFPYIAGVNGGAAFIVVYLACICIIGLPVLTSEFIIGRRGQKNVIGSYVRLAGKSSPWLTGGFISLFCSATILSFYGVVAGWSLEYIVKALTNSFAGKTPAEVGGLFGSFVSSPLKPIIWQLVFMGITAAVICAGVKKGIERFSTVMMPLLLAIIVLLCIRSVTLPGAENGIAFLFKPDFSKLSAAGMLDALGHAFFTLSLGAGTMITYGSYFNKKEGLAATAVQVSVADTVIAILAGVAIFPAVFSFGLEPGAGPGLVFVTLPNVFAQMPGGYFFCILFFVLIAVAALTSSVSMLEVGVAYVTEDLGIDRVKATLLLTFLISFVGIFCSLSFGRLKELTFFSKNVFDLADFLVSNIGMPLAGMLSVLFVAWGLGRTNVEDEMSSGGSVPIGYLSAFMIVTKYLAPLGIAIVFLHSLGII